MINKKLLILICLILVIVFSGRIYSQNNVGKIYESEKQTWIDAETSYEITQWTNNSARSWHLYFNIESFIDNDNVIIFSERSGKKNLFKLNLQSGQMIQMTDEENMDSDVWHLQNLKTLWYLSGNKIKSLNTETFETKIAAEFEGHIESFTVTCDGKNIVYSLNKNPGFSENIVPDLTQYLNSILKQKKQNKFHRTTDLLFLIYRQIRLIQI